MFDLPDSMDVLIATLQWLGVPFALWIPAMLVIWLADWAKAVSGAAQTSIHFWGWLKSQRLSKLAFYIFLHAVLIATVYSAFRLIAAMMKPNAAGVTIADGRSFSWQEVWISISTFSASDALSIQALYTAVGILLAFNVAHVIGASWLAHLIALPVALLIWLGRAVVAFVIIAGFCVWSLATWLHNPKYSIDMVYLYVMWLVLLIGFALAAALTAELAEDMYQS